MIHLLSLQNTPKHDRKTFIFTEGLNLIVGENESGKSLILEFIDYALHGSVALRLPISMYSSGLFVCLITTIGNSRYRIERSPKKVELYNDENNELIAKGSRPVDAEIRKLLGYNRNVFLMANYSCQDQISYLSSMSPAERKRTIDNVVGLTSVEQVIKQHKEELTVLNRLERALTGREVEKPSHPAFVRCKNVDELLAEKRKKVAEYAAQYQAEITLRDNLKALAQHKPQEMPQPDMSAIIPEWTVEQVITHKNTVQHHEKHLVELKERLAADEEPTRLPTPDTTYLIEGLTQAKIEHQETQLASIRGFINIAKENMVRPNEILEKGTYSLDQIKEAEDAEELHHNWRHVNNLKSKGIVVCTHCGGDVYLAADSMAAYKDLIHLENVQPPAVSSRAMRETRYAYMQAEKELAELNPRLESFKQRESELLDNWYSKEQIENHTATEVMLDKFEAAEKHHADWLVRTEGLRREIKSIETELAEIEKIMPSFEALDAHVFALKELDKYKANQDAIKKWQEQYDSLGQFVGEDYLEKLLEHKSLQEVEIAGLETSKTQWAEYDRLMAQYQQWYDEYSTNHDAVEREQEIVNALQDYKGRIKSSILPSVNAVATTWIKRMSQGHHFKVELTDKMEILVNDEPIEALSISGRALGHLALRMALGQVLTTRVYPVFIADEVDASMRDNRAQDVLNALTDMLNGPVKQIIMISHRELDHEATVIEV